MGEKFILTGVAVDGVLMVTVDSVVGALRLRQGELETRAAATTGEASTGLWMAAMEIEGRADAFAVAQLEAHTAQPELQRRAACSNCHAEVEYCRACGAKLE